MMLLSSAVIIFTAGPAYSELTIDGRLDEPDWAEAKVFEDFVVVKPLTHDTPGFHTRAMLLSLPEGLAVAFVCEQPEDNRTRTVSQRDSMGFDSDAVTLVVDFDGRGEKAYQFSVSITGSYMDGTLNSMNDFNRDWDGLWQRAVQESDGHWTVEMLIPWSIASMREGGGDTRLIGVYFERDLYERNETFAFPGVNSDLSRFLLDIEPVEVARYTKGEFNFWPYVTVLHDLLNGGTTGKMGLDVFWKLNGALQLAATFNPDFGQVESDDLVVNFTAIETRFSDKRAFFTENQSIFNDYLLMNESVFYTRRVGGPRDDNMEPSDIDAAVKIVGSAGVLNYGVFAAREADAEDVGKSFYTGKLVYPGKIWTLGAQTTYTERPFLDRSALVNTVQYDIKPTDAWRLFGQFVESEIDEVDSDTDGFGTFNAVQYTPNDQLNFEVSNVYYDDTLDINDMGYLRRNDLNEWAFSFQYQRTDFPETSRTASVSWMMWNILSENTNGDDLMDGILINRQQTMRDGSSYRIDFHFDQAGYDDQISRGNGLVYLKERYSFGLSYMTQRQGAFSKSAGIEAFQEGVENWGLQVDAGVTWYPSDALNIDFNLQASESRDWLIWLRDDLLASFSRSRINGNITGNWFPGEKHEIRLNTQWIAIDAEAQQGYRIGSGGRLAPSSDAVDDFAVINFGLQLRYRYEIAPLSDLYLVYSRGGFEQIEDPTRNILELAGDTPGLRDSDQFLVKLRYRF